MSMEPNTQELTRAERRKKGKSLRKEAPRGSHGDWQPGADRPNPLDLLQAQDEGRHALLAEAPESPSYRPSISVPPY